MKMDDDFFYFKAFFIGMNKLIYSIFLLLCFFFVSCGSVENIVVLNSSTGINLFLRNTMLNTKHKIVSACEFDITVNTVKNEISEDPTVNYTFSVTKNNYSEGEKVSFYFENNGKRYGVFDSEMMFHSLKANKDMDVRFTSKMNRNDFNEIMSNFDAVHVVLVLSDGSEILISDKIITEKFNDLRLLVK